jgi:hypothetical protein
MGIPQLGERHMSFKFWIYFPQLHVFLQTLKSYDIKPFNNGYGMCDNWNKDIYSTVHVGSFGKLGYNRSICWKTP